MKESQLTSNHYAALQNCLESGLDDDRNDHGA
ncbi:MAG: hypothetical protein JWQ19_2753, partial [Subtercola sp.]|nr:hypothetical protein [Subtercola sp.]